MRAVLAVAPGVFVRVRVDGVPGQSHLFVLSRLLLDHDPVLDLPRGVFVHR